MPGVGGQRDGRSRASRRFRPAQKLMTLEAMKMETHIVAEREGTVDRVLVKPGDRVQAKDLMIVWKTQ